jgi:hypothetical protein
VYGLSTNTPMPLTLAFETRAGRVGLLQITGFTDSPRGVSIRYKLAQSESKVTGDQVALEDLALRMVPAIREKMTFPSRWRWLLAIRRLYDYRDPP